MSKITIIHPSRSRPEQCASTMDKWISRADHKSDLEYLISVDKSDPLLKEYQMLAHTDVIVISDNKTAIEAINCAAKYATGDIFIVVSDDFDCPNHWDTLLMEQIGEQEDYVVKTMDGCQPWIITLPIMDRKYYNRFGYIYNPLYEHLFCDTEMSHVGALLGRTITVDLVFPHRHYTQAGGHPKDAINEKNDNTWVQGETVYLERMKNNFGIENPERITLPNHLIHWLRVKGVAV